MTMLAEAPPPLPATSRIHVLREIAIHYKAFEDPMQSRSGLGDGIAIPLMPNPWNHYTVREFTRLLNEMRGGDHRLDPRPLIKIKDERVSIRQLRWHLDAYYISATYTIRHVPITLRRGRRIALLRDQDGEPITTQPVKCDRRAPGARKDLAEAALAWMAEHWTHPLEPMLPDELRERTP